MAACHPSSGGAPGAPSIGQDAPTPLLRWAIVNNRGENR
jgi:hypothetical protein